MAGLTLEKVRKTFGDTEVVKGVDLTIEDGEFVVFVGPSGCGKSTLLRLLAGLEDLSGGSIAIGGRDVSTLEPSARGVAMVFQSYALYPHMSVERNIGFALRMNGMPKPEVRRKVEAAADILHLRDLLSRRPSELSGGQRQRVAIGRAIVREPDVFLFDEPLSNLDAELRAEMRLEIARLHQELGATMIFVTHDQVEAMTLADRIVVLNAGRVEQIGRPLELYDDPANLFVATFIGAPRMNLLRAVIADSTGGSVRFSLPDHPNAGFLLPMETPPSQGAELLLGLRPEHFAAGLGVPLSARVDVIEHLGSASFAYCGTETERPLTVELRNGRDAESGTELRTGFDPASCLLFDPLTGARLR
ncbi:ABC transporter ATP-binding protein [Consotaella aegiceratis]|uniref:ABC transporter ATP-binding protein n=1 Tax=Consotaella aegiceratis TaxID=3097961 RepID=UPI002F3F99C5